MSVRIQKDSENGHCGPGEDRVDPTERRYLDAFFESFHHRWALIHRPSWEEKNNETPLIAAMKMIGAWLHGTQESREHAVRVHEKLMENVMARLVRPSKFAPS